MPTYRRQPVAFVRGEGAALFDAEGRRYVDCMAGISMNNAGHCHPAVVAAIAEQAGRLINVSNLYYSEPMVALAEWIRDRSLGGRVYFCNSGAEATEAALKLARKRGGPGRTEVVALVDGFHGRTYGRALAHRPARQAGPVPAAGSRHHATSSATIRRGCEAAVGPRTCAIVMEVVQGEVGVHARAHRDAAPGARAGRPPRGAPGARRDPDRPLAHRPAVRPTRTWASCPDVMCLGQEPRWRRADRRRGGAARARRGSPARRPRLHVRRQPAGLRGRPRVVRGARDPALQDGVRRKGAALLASLEGLVADGLATEARGRGLMCAIDLPRAPGRRGGRRAPARGLPGQQHLRSHPALPAAAGRGAGRSGRPGGGPRAGAGSVLTSEPCA